METQTSGPRRGNVWAVARVCAGLVLAMMLGFGGLVWWLRTANSLLLPDGSRLYVLTPARCSGPPPYSRPVPAISKWLASIPWLQLTVVNNNLGRMVIQNDSGVVVPSAIGFWVEAVDGSSGVVAPARGAAGGVMPACYEFTLIDDRGEERPALSSLHLARNLPVAVSFMPFATQRKSLEMEVYPILDQMTGRRGEPLGTVSVNLLEQPQTIARTVDALPCRKPFVGGEIELTDVAVESVSTGQDFFATRPGLAYTPKLHMPNNDRCPWRVSTQMDFTRPITQSRITDSFGTSMPFIFNRLTAQQDYWALSLQLVNDDFASLPADSVAALPRIALPENEGSTDAEHVVSLGPQKVVCFKATSPGHTVVDRPIAQGMMHSITLPPMPVSRKNNARKLQMITRPDPQQPNVNMGGIFLPGNNYLHQRVPGIVTATLDSDVHALWFLVEGLTTENFLVQVATPDGTAIPGEVTTMAGVALWTPDAELPAGLKELDVKVSIQEPKAVEFCIKPPLPAGARQAP